jgi:carboxymethylenebutenolidase
MGKMIELAASDGHKLAAYRADPAGKPRGGIVVIQEIFGVNSHIKQVADGYAGDGYLAIAPALFDRVERNIDLGYTPEDIARGREIRGKVANDMAMKDSEAAIKAASSAGKVGIVGYCWGGLVTWLAANKLSGLSAAVAYYGGGILDNTNLAPKVPLMGHFGDKDQHIPVDGVKKLAEKYPQHPIHIYSADHGFNCDHRGSYDAAAAKQARQRTLEFFRKHIG